MIGAAGQIGEIVKLGSRGTQVREIQELLVKAGFPLEVDGIFGPKTRDAVIRFQRQVGLRPDGIVGERTYAALLRVTQPKVRFPPEYWVWGLVALGLLWVSRGQ